MTARPRLLIAVTVVAILSACADGPTTPDRVRAPADSAAGPVTLPKLRIVSGDSQSASPGAPVPLLLQVRATDLQGNPLPGVSVRFVVTTGSGGVSGSTAATNDSGVATSGAWTLGPAEGPQRVIAWAPGHEQVDFTAFARVPPAPDPDGQSAAGKLVYVRDGAIWQSTDSQPLLLFRPANRIYAPAVSRDGAIAYVTGTSLSQVCIAASGSTEPRCIDVSGHGNINGLAWSPDGKQVLFSGQLVVSTGNGTTSYFAERVELLAVDVARMLVRPIVAGVRGVDAIGASWSPDGSVIAFANRGGIWLVDGDGSQLRELVAHVGGPYSAMGVRWSPDGRKFSLTLRDESQCDWLCNSAVGTLNADGNGLKVLAVANVATDQFVGSHSAPIWSPDGKTIAFGRSDCSSGWDPCREDVSVAEADGGPPRPLLDNGILLDWHER